MNVKVSSHKQSWAILKNKFAWEIMTQLKFYGIPTIATCMKTSWSSIEKIPSKPSPVLLMHCHFKILVYASEGANVL